jgi:hypothetical protein
MNGRKGKHIISASRRTDIPKFYGEWFMKRIKEGYCMVPNPLFPTKAYEVSLKPGDVLAIVFWSKDPKPLIPHLSVLDEKKFRYYFQLTLNNYDRELEPCVPDLERRVDTFLELSGRLGRDRVIWRYDPIILSNKTGVGFHLENVDKISHMLKGATERLVISFIDDYNKTKARLDRLKSDPGYDFSADPLSADGLDELLAGINQMAQGSGLKVFSCAEDVDLAKYNIEKGSCIDAGLIEKIWPELLWDKDFQKLHKNKNLKKDPNQRPACLCVTSKDIGENNTCRHGCAYCYATSGTKEPGEYNKDHNSDWDSITGDCVRTEVVA